MIKVTSLQWRTKKNNKNQHFSLSLRSAQITRRTYVTAPDSS